MQKKDTPEGPPQTRFRNRILLSILLPVLLAGTLISIVSSHYLNAALFSFLHERLNAELKLASRLGLRICDSNMNYLLELRLENDAEMNASLRNEAVEEVKGVSGQFRNLHMMVVADSGQILGSSSKTVKKGAAFPLPGKKSDEILSENLGENPVKIHYRYFPLWKWHIVSFVFEKDYLAPIESGKKIVYLTMAAVLAAIWLVLLAALSFFVNAPLRKIVAATRGVAAGRFDRLPLNRKDEIGQVVYAFNSMVGSLDAKNNEVSNLIGELRESEGRYRVLFEGATEGILVAEISTGQIKYANPAICKMLGYAEQEMIGLTFTSIHPESAMVSVLAEFDAMAAGEKSLAPDIPCYRKDGTLIYADIKGTQVTYDQTACYLGFFTDITARQLVENEKRELRVKLQRVEKMEALGTLAGGVAHDLNNILSGLVSYPELLLLDLPQDSPLRGPILTIGKSGKKAAAIVQDLLTLARRGVAVTEVANLSGIVHEYLQSPEHARLKKYHPKVQFEARLSEKLLNVMGSPVHLSKTVMNLVSNAAEALPDGGRVQITTRNMYVDQPIRGYDDVNEGDYALLCVTDDGTGIPETDIDRIFEPFFTKKKMGRSGTGLGMAVVWGTVKDHDGYIHVVSKPGEETRFELYFPVTRKEAREAGVGSAINAYMGGGQTILVVDDVHEQREIATMLLSRLGYVVFTVSSGEAAVDFMASRSVDLVILDMIMDPGMDGLDTYREILKRQPGQRAIIASGFSETDRVKAAQKLGARQYVRKPYTLENIAMAVKAEMQ